MTIDKKIISGIGSSYYQLADYCPPLEIERKKKEMIKKCSKCKKEKDLHEFSLDKSRKDGLRIYCKLCCSKKAKEFRLRNLEKLKGKAKIYNLVNRERINRKHKGYRLGRKGAKNEYERKRRQDNPKYRLRHAVSNLVGRRLRKRISSKKGKSILNFLPYTIDELMERLESKFKLGMTWDNYGKMACGSHYSRL